MDCDFYRDETQMVLAFKAFRLAWLNLRTGEFTLAKKINGYYGFNKGFLLSAQFMRSLPFKSVFTYTSTGCTHAINEEMETEVFSINLMKELLHETWRPFQKAIELRDFDNRLQTKTKNGISCLIASIVEGNNNQHNLFITRFYSFQSHYNVTMKCQLNKDKGVLDPNVSANSVS